MFTQLYDRNLPPEPVPDMVRCCPCGEKVTTQGEDAIDVCRDHGVVEDQTVDVPWQVYEDGPEATLAYIWRPRV